jgi:maltose-binding protein MalE
MRRVFVSLLLPLSTAAEAVVVHELSSRDISSSLVLWHTLNSQQSIALKQSIERFSKKTGIDVKLESGMDLTAALLKQKRRGALPDAVWGAADLIAIGNEIDLSPVPKNLIPSSIGRRFIEELTLENQPIGVPILSGNHLMLFTNTNIVSTPAQSWEEIAEQHKTLKAKNISTVALPVGEPYFFLPFMLHAGSFSDGVLSPNLGGNWSKLEEALKNYGSMVDTGIVPATCSFSCVFSDFLAGKFAYAITGDWQYAEAHAALGDNLQISALPTLQGKPMRTISATQGLFFPGNSLQGKHQKSLKALALHLLNGNEQYQFALATGRIPVDTGALIRLSNTNLSRSQSDLIRVFKDSLTLRSTRETVLTWLLLRKTLAYRIANIAPTPAIIEFLQTSTNQRLQSYRGKPK